MRALLARCLAKIRFRPAVAALALCLTSGFAPFPTARASTPEADAEAALMPFLDVLASPPAGKYRAFRVRGRVESIGPVSFIPNGMDSSHLDPGALQNLPSFDFALQPPDRLRISAPVGETVVTGCRNQQKLWAAPGAQVQPILEGLRSLPRPRRNERNLLQPIQLPFSGRQLAMLPILLEVQNRGQTSLDQSPARVLDVRVQPDISKLLPQEVSGWGLRLWLNAQGRPARLGLQTPEGKAVVRIEKIEFAPSFPDPFWASPEDARSLTPAEFEDIARTLGAAAKNLR
jgi:hypothetical protein